MAPPGAIPHIVWLVRIEWKLREPIWLHLGANIWKSRRFLGGAISIWLPHHWLGGAQNDSPTWARLISEQWLLLWSQNGSFSFMCAWMCPIPKTEYQPECWSLWKCIFHFKNIKKNYTYPLGHRNFFLCFSFTEKVGSGQGIINLFLNW